MSRHPNPGPPQTAAAEAEKLSPAEEIVKLVIESRAELFHSPEREPYLSMPVDGHSETFAIGTKQSDFRDWLERLYYERKQKVASESAIREAASVLAGKAKHEGQECTVFNRIAENRASIYVDLGNEIWQGVRISPDGWEVVDNPPVKFRRSLGMQALPVPIRGGSVDQLRPLINIGGGDQWVLLVAWLISAFRPTGPYPLLLLQGTQGSAKSTLSRVLRMLIDPNTAPSRSAPRNEHDLMISATCGWCMAFDNLSTMRPWFSDALCRLATGSALSTRRYYSDNSERLFQAVRPILINGIDVNMTRGDLLDRTLIMSLPAIAPADRRTEDGFWPGFDAIRPAILGALFTAVSCSLQHLSQVRLPELPRMADFAKWVTAAEPALGWAPGTFLAAYNRNRATSNELALEGSVLVPAIRKLAADGGLTDTATNLLSALQAAAADGGEYSTNGWPTNARSLSAMLHRLAPNLEAVGISIQFGQTAGDGSQKLISISKLTAPQPVIP